MEGKLSKKEISENLDILHEVALFFENAIPFATGSC